MAVRELPLPPDKGVERLVIRGSSFLDLPRAATVRARYNEYPERWPLNPMFPQPGRRGGSPVKAAQNAPRPVAAPGSPGEEGATEVAVPISEIYPVERDRGDIPPLGIADNIQGTGISPVASCVGAGGTIVGGSSNVGAGTTVISVTPLCPFPFIVTAAHFKTNLAALDQTVYFVVKMSDDQATAAGENEQGDRLFIKAGGAGRIRQFGEWLTLFPEERYDLAPKFFKFILVNGSGGAVNMLVFLSIRRSDG